MSRIWRFAKNVVNGWLEADGRRIYEAKDLRVGLFKPETAPA